MKTHGAESESSQWSKCGDDSYKAEQTVTNLSFKYSQYVNCDGKLTAWWRACQRDADDP